ncbi:MAG: dienelactone hydrolase family protein [Candidatus Aquilonibacter sp.]
MSSSTDRVTLSVADGSTMDAYVARPKSGTPTAGMLVFQEAFGVNAYMRDVSDRFAALGFLAIAPELFHRTGPGFEGSYTDFAAVRPHMAALSTDGLHADIDAAYNWLRGQDINAPRIGAVGFCMGGRVAYMANARVQLGTAISFYGGGIVPDLLPLAQAQRAPILMFWGGLDTHIPPEQYRAVADALTAAQATHEQVVFSQADHGFFCDARASYNAIASQQATAMVNAFLEAYGLL